MIDIDKQEAAQQPVRPPWAETDALLRTYYDTEWGLPVTDERGVFERLCLEGFQAGLSWRTVLAKRENFRRLFEGFEVEEVAAMTEADIVRLAQEPGIIRHAGKIRAAIGNARATLALRELPETVATGGQRLSLAAGSLVTGQRIDAGLPALIWAFQPERTYLPVSQDEVPTQSPASALLSKTLKKLGYRFIGPTSAFALMEAIGVVNTNLLGTHRRNASGLWSEDGTALGLKR